MTSERLTTRWFALSVIGTDNATGVEVAIGLLPLGLNRAPLCFWRSVKDAVLCGLRVVAPPVPTFARPAQIDDVAHESGPLFLAKGVDRDDLRGGRGFERLFRRHRGFRLGALGGGFGGRRLGRRRRGRGVRVRQFG